MTKLQELKFSFNANAHYLPQQPHPWLAHIVSKQDMKCAMYTHVPALLNPKSEFYLPVLAESKHK